MKCPECGTRMKANRENYRYDACGLKNVTLVDVGVSRCPKCGETEVAIRNIAGLHRALALALARRPERLAGAEIRFLRKYLAFSGVDFAQHLGVTPETVSRWEQGTKPMGPTAERLVRWMIVTREPLSHYPLEMLKDVATRDARPHRLGMKAEQGRWAPVAA